jgi:hypothetical protein
VSKEEISGPVKSEMEEKFMGRRKKKFSKTKYVLHCIGCY